MNNYKEIKSGGIEYRKIQALVGEHSLFCVLPKAYAIKIGIQRGDFVKVSQMENQIIIEKA
ncbi:MAG: AbrB/MazE/SpoVT family DNA-binding domain-containing protein [Nitrososphaeraceae archaeon]